MLIFIEIQENTYLHKKVYVRDFFIHNKYPNIITFHIFDIKCCLHTSQFVSKVCVFISLWLV